MRLEHLEYLQARQETYDSSETTGDVTSPGVHEAVAQSASYRLPYELRRKILIFAFGNYTYHVGVIDDRANQDPWFTDCKPECLKWFGGICRRDANELPPFQDGCMADPAYPYHFMENIGVLGWLCSCRLGYTEGIDVLYSTNTFYIRNTVLVQNLEVVFPPKHLAHIRSLELLGFFYLENWPDYTPKMARVGWHGLEAVLFGIRDRCPSLRKLHLFLETYDVDAYIAWREDEGDPFDPIVDTIEKALGMIDEIVCQKHDDLKVEVAISKKVWLKLRRRGPGEIAPQYPRLSVVLGKDDTKAQQFPRRTVWLEG